MSLTTFTGRYGHERYVSPRWVQVPAESKVYPLSYRDFHMAKLASVAEAAPLLPEGANGLAANGGLAVPEGATVSLQRQGDNMKL